MNKMKRAERMDGIRRGGGDEGPAVGFSLRESTVSWHRRHLTR